MTANTNGGKPSVVGTTTSIATNVTVNLTNTAQLYGDWTFSAANFPLLSSYTALAADGLGRRSTNTVNVTLSTDKTAYVYDGNVVIRERNINTLPTTTYTRGLDLSGSLQGAGGVGGLLKVAYYGTATTNCFVAYDANGNVSALINAADGTTPANYEYGPFGELIRATGPMAKLNPFRFSTKFDDDETDLLYLATNRCRKSDHAIGVDYSNSMRKKVRRLAFWGAVTLLFLMILSYLIHPSRFDVVTYTADRVWIEPPGALSSFCESTYQLFYEPIRGKEWVVNLHANFEHQPLIVFCPTNNGRIFCLYDSDVLIRLIKIDTNNTFQGFPKGSPLNWIVRSSSFDVREGTKGDWKLAIDCLECMDSRTFRRQSIRGLNVGFVSVDAYKKQLLKSVRKQADAMYQLDGGETTMPLFR